MTIDEHILANEVLREMQNELNDPFLQEVLHKQTAKGIAKYPNTVNVNDYSVTGWMDHAIEELMDATIYAKLTLKRAEMEGFSVEVMRNIRFIMNKQISNNMNNMTKMVAIRKLIS